MGEWHVFGGLTYDPRRVLVGSHQLRMAKPHPEAVQKHIRGWLGEANRRLDGRVEAAVVAVEAHKSGWPHAHPLLRLAGGLQHGDLAAIGQVWYERRGYAKLEPPKSVADVTVYAAKYLSKDVLGGGVLLWPSRGPMDIHQLGQDVTARGGDRALAGAGFHVPRLAEREQDWRAPGAETERWRSWRSSPWNR